MRAAQHDGARFGIGGKPPVHVCPQRVQRIDVLFDGGGKPVERRYQNVLIGKTGDQPHEARLRSGQRRHQHEHRPVAAHVAGRLDGRFRPDDGHVEFLPHRLYRYGRRGIAGNDRRLGAGIGQSLYAKAGAVQDFPARAAAVRRVRAVGQIQIIFAREKAHRLVQHGDTAHAAVKKPDGTILIGFHHTYICADTGLCDRRPVISAA